MDDEIFLSGLQHYCFCKYQWWLSYVENEWLDNVHTTLGNLIHSNVDKPEFYEKRGNKEIRRSLAINSREFGLYGIADLVEFHNTKDRLVLKVIEYKKGAPDDGGEVKIFDGLQLYAQMVCLQEMMPNARIEGYIYYDKVRRRIKLKNLEFYREMLIKVLVEQRNIISNGQIPKKNIGKHCKSCSMSEICLPFLGEKNA